MFFDQAVDGLPAGWFDGFEDAAVAVLKSKLTAIGLLSKIPALEAAEVVAVVVVDQGHVVKAGYVVCEEWWTSLETVLASGPPVEEAVLKAGRVDDSVPELRSVELMCGSLTSCLEGMHHALQSAELAEPA